MRKHLFVFVLLVTLSDSALASTRVVPELAEIASVRLELRLRGEEIAGKEVVQEEVIRIASEELAKRHLNIESDSEFALELNFRFLWTLETPNRTLVISLLAQVVHAPDAATDDPSRLLWQETYLLAVPEEHSLEEIGDLASFSVEHLAFLWERSRLPQPIDQECDAEHLMTSIH